YNGALYFGADDGTTSNALWKSDGTLAGTVMVPTSTFIDSPNNALVVNDLLFFVAVSGPGSGRKLWRSDGTTFRSATLTQNSSGATLTSPDYVTSFNGMVFFKACSPVEGCELFKTDGTQAGTTLVADIQPGELSSSPAQLTSVNGTLYFFVSRST